MRSSLITALAALAATAAASSAGVNRPGRGGMRPIPAGDGNDYANIHNTTFEQLIDHSNPSLGTFSQWYMYDTTYYGGPGSPVVVFTPGEVNASLYTNYLTTNRTTGVIAQQIKAAVIVLEHRYWGFSSPFQDLTTENMQYLTLENSVADINHFAATVKLPFDTNGSSNAANAPWVMVGGSYSGALTAWVATTAPGTIWAYLASSAVVEAYSNFWAYFLPVQEGMPANCSKDVNLVIDHMDSVMATGSAAEKQDLKAMFGLETVEHDDDFMAALENGPWLWQSNQFYTTGGFFTWCDYVENSVNQTDASKLPSAEGVGLEKALKGYAEWSKDYFFPGFCNETYGYYSDGLNTECLNTYNASNQLFTDMTLGNTGLRQWNWILCDWPLGYWQDGAPEGHSTLVSRLVDVDYWTRQCALYFPPGPNGETYGLAKGATEAQVNAYTGGWSAPNTTRLTFTNGGYDPWRDTTVSSDIRPGGPLQSTEQVPIRVVPGGFHTSDLVTENGVVNAGCKQVIDEEVAQIVQWVGEWDSEKNGNGNGGGSGPGHNGPPPPPPNGPPHGPPPHWGPPGQGPPGQGPPSWGPPSQQHGPPARRWVA